MIEIEDLTFRRGRTVVLSEISLTLPRGGLTALIGPNGAGKSTLFALMARLLPIQSGHIRFDGLDVQTTASMTLARKLAILRQDASVATRISVRDLVGFGRFPHHRGRPTDTDREQVEAALAYFDLEPIAGRFIDELSGGQRQRALVAMAYCQDTDYLLLDEPLNNLDMYYSRALMRELRALADRHGRTVVVVLHEVNYAAAYADHVVALKDGRLVADGPTETVMTPERLSSVFGMSVDIRRIDGRLVALHHA